MSTARMGTTPGERSGDPRFARSWRELGGQRWLDAIAYLDRERDEWARHLA